MNKEMELTPQPPSANSPLPAWSHYEVTRFSDTAIQGVLPPLTVKKNKEYLIGLDLEYFVAKEEDGEETSYAMPFGKAEPTDEETHNRETALKPEFVEKLYEQVYDYIKNKVVPPYFVTDVKMQIRTNKVLYVIRYPCRTIGSTYQGLPVVCSGNCGSGARRKCYKDGNIRWVCKHISC